MTLIELVALVGAVVVAVLAYRGHSAQKAARMRLLDACRPVVEAAKVQPAADGFPYIDGRWQNHRIRAELIPDSMTVKRLPQLWLKLTQIEDRKIPSFAVLIRPNGAEFYSLTNDYKYRLEPPHDFRTEVLIKGTDPQAQKLLDGLSPVLAQIFADKRMKEVAVTSKGLRLIWQAVEGSRGSHLILRQLTFSVDELAADDFQYCLQQLGRLSDAIDNLTTASASRS
jgi:hypothetical protein